MSYNILAFCGGGIRGLASVTMLKQLMANHPNVVSDACMLAGTSTGATIVANLANGKSPSDVIDFFETTEKHFFKNKIFNPLKNPARPQYSIEEISLAAKLEYRSQTLADLAAKSKKDLLMTSFQIGDLSSKQAWGPVLFTNLASQQNSNTLVADAMVASGSMQGMFGAHKIEVDGTAQYFVDGAYVNHDPTLAAISLAVESGVALSDICVICFGTGFMMNALGAAAASWGPQQWQDGDKNNPYDISPLLVNGTASPILNISLNGTSTNSVPMLANLMLGAGRYAYLNPVLERFIPENDTDEADLDYLKAQAEAVDLTGAEAVLKNWSQSDCAASS